MGFDTIIKNGTVVTATDTYAADVAIANGKISAIGTDLLRVENATKILDASGKLVVPGGIDVHTHLDMPFGGTTSADDFETGTRAAAFGGTTTLIDFAIQYKGQPLRQAFDTWMSKASTKAVCDYAFHCIVTDVSGGQLSEMNDSGARGRDQLQTLHGVSRRLHARRWQHLQSAAEHGEERRSGLHARRKRQRDRRDRAAGAGRRQEGAEVSCVNSPHHGRGRSCRTRHRAGRNGRRAASTSCT